MPALPPPPSQEEYEDADIVFSSHADTLQIAQCYIAGADERLFSQVRTRGGKIRVTDGSEGGEGEITLLGMHGLFFACLACESCSVFFPFHLLCLENSWRGGEC